MIRAISRRGVLGAAGGGLLSVMLPQSRAQETAERFRYSITDFTAGGTDGWLPGFADFSLETAATNRVAEVRALPDSSRTGYYLRGRNTSDDLFMYLKKPVTRLAANRSYQVSFHVQVASAAPAGCVGIGGAPGESVWLKAGASMQEPISVLGQDGIRLSVDKGNQAGGGVSGLVLGTIANGIRCEDSKGEFVLMSQTGTLPNAVTADPSGTAWVFVGTDSGFEGTTEIYYAFIAVLFTLQS